MRKKFKMVALLLFVTMIFNPIGLNLTIVNAATILSDIEIIDVPKPVIGEPIQGSIGGLNVNIDCYIQGDWYEKVQTGYFQPASDSVFTEGKIYAYIMSIQLTGSDRFTSPVNIIYDGQKIQSNVGTTADLTTKYEQWGTQALMVSLVFDNVVEPIEKDIREIIEENAKGSTCQYTIFPTQAKYKVILDGESAIIPDSEDYTISYKDTDDKDLYPTDLSGLRDKLAELDYTNSDYNKDYTNLSYDVGTNTITYNGGLVRGTIGYEDTVLVNTNGVAKRDTNIDSIREVFEKTVLVHDLEESITANEDQLELITDEDVLKHTLLDIANTKKDIKRISNINLPVIKKSLANSIIYSSPFYTGLGECNLDTYEGYSEYEVTYTLYALIFRDLRLNNASYVVEGSKDTIDVPEFNPDKYEYNIELPEDTRKDAMIITSAQGMMKKLIEENSINYTDPFDPYITIKNTDVTLQDGKGIAKIIVTYNMYKELGSGADKSYSSNPTREYTINFSVKEKESEVIDDPVNPDPIVTPDNPTYGNFTELGYYKGDLDKDGVVNANDAAVALKLYNYGGVTSEDLKIGDMDNDGIINANDAALILKVYNYGY